MNRNQNILWVLFLSLSLMGCERSLEEINVNPNESAITNPNHLFTYALVKSNTSYLTDVQVEQWGVMNWTMSLATLGGREESRMFEMPGQKDEYWKELYTQALSNTFEVIKLTRDNAPQRNLTAIARIWKAYLFHQLTDVYGSVPYYEALRGIDYNILSPAYDTQQVIILDLLQSLKEAGEMLDGEKISFESSADLLYGGDVERWRAFANALRMRLAMRISDVLPDITAEVLDDLKNSLFISDNQGSALFPFNLNDQQNPFFEVNYKGEDANRNFPSQLLIDYLKSNDDPRLPLMAQPTLLSQLTGMPDYVGVPGLVSSASPLWNNYEDDGRDVSALGEWYLRAEAKGVIFSYAEVCFLQAEAVLKGFWSGDANELLRRGVAADMMSYNDEVPGSVTQEAMDTYLDALPEATVEVVMMQKWIALAFRNGYEVWADFRRTGYPQLRDAVGAPVQYSNYPLRLTYPASEVSLNTAHYLEAVAQQGADKATTPLWWDVL